MNDLNDLWDVVKSWIWPGNDKEEAIEFDLTVRRGSRVDPFAALSEIDRRPEFARRLMEDGLLDFEIKGPVHREGEDAVDYIPELRQRHGFFLSEGKPRYRKADTNRWTEDPAGVDADSVDQIHVAGHID